MLLSLLSSPKTTEIACVIIRRKKEEVFLATDDLLRFSVVFFSL